MLVAVAREADLAGRKPMAELAPTMNEEGWWTLRSRPPGQSEFGGRIYVDATGKMTPGLIDLSLQALRGPTAAVALSRKDALALADELRRVALDAECRCVWDSNPACPLHGARP